MKFNYKNGEVFAMVEVLLLGTGATRPLPHRALAAMWLAGGRPGMLL